jgi:hypothetical protein
LLAFWSEADRRRLDQWRRERPQHAEGGVKEVPANSPGAPTTSALAMTPSPSPSRSKTRRKRPILDRVLAGTPAEMVCYPVSKMVNNPRNNRPELIVSAA